MTSPDDGTKRRLIYAGALAAALAAGFAIARVTSPADVPAPAEKASVGPTELVLEAANIEAGGIAVEKVQAGDLAGEILAPASVVATPNGEAAISANASGTVSRITKRLGDPVRAGETLAIVQSRDAAAMTADRATADAKLVVARKAAAREQELFDKRVSPRQDLEMAQANLSAAEAEARRARSAAGSAHVTGDGSLAIVSPLSGRITAQRIELGAFVQADTELFRVADPKLIQIEASVSAVDAAKVAAGNTASVITQSGQTLEATVRSVTPTLDPQTRTASVILSVKGGSGLTPGETLQARITTKGASAKAILIPEEALQSVDGRDVVFVRSAKGFTVQPVVVSSRGAGRASVISGLTAGQSIAARNAFLLKAELSKGSEEEE